MNGDGFESAKSNPPVLAATTAAPTNLVAHWTFDDGSGATATDASGNGHDGTLINGPLWAAGQVGSNALDFKWRGGCG